ncbi:unnamed protein product [Hymenolepis diminuta]|uniref:Enhancer of mRNA-decapping protein 4 n=1 Tax=Hymenolepis diminuta TaxID=6216 RepID=A0A158QFC6_HYMDI|nr:unnamed protein product [Hymenolepis diminuta]
MFRWGKREPISDVQMSFERGRSIYVHLVIEIDSTVRKQKAEAAKQLSQLEVAVKNLQLTVPATGTNLSSDVFTAAHPLVSPTVGLNNKQLVEQVRGVVRNELCNLFQTNASKIVEPVIQNLRGNLERILSPLPQIVADRMLTVIKEPKFTQYIADQMGRSLSPVMTEGYRNELRQTLVPGLNSVVDKLCKDLDDLVQGALNRRKLIASIFSYLNSNSGSFGIKIAKVAGRVGEVLNKALQQQQAKSQQSQSEPFFGGNSSSTAGSGRPSTIPPLNPSPQQQQFKNPNIGSNDTFTKALTFIQSGQYSQALETALTSPNQTVLLQVLQRIPVVPLFDQNIRQEMLLSLIHQLSCGDLQEQLEMKLPFLQEAVNHLRVNDSTVREMGSGILNALFNKLSMLRLKTKLNTAQENRAMTLQRSLSEKGMALMS